MSFLMSNQRTVPPDGDPESKICIIGEAPGAMEVNQGKPFVGPAGSVLEQCLHGAGLIRGEVYLTNALKHKIANVSPYYNERTKRLTEKGEEAKQQLLEELKECGSNIFIPLGNLPTAMLTGMGGIIQKRGYISSCDDLRGRKVLPTIHPAAAIRGNYIYRYYITADLRKAKANADTPDIKWPDVEIHIPHTADEAVQYLQFLKTQKVLSIDIEVYNYEVSCIGFCPEPNVAYVIPFYFDSNRWTEFDETRVWIAVAEIMGDESITKIGQNFIFDMQFLCQRNNILTRGYLDDTMIKSACCFPDFSKGLEFLVSIHCNRPQWKDMVKWKGSDIVKKES